MTVKCTLRTAVQETMVLYVNVVFVCSKCSGKDKDVSVSFFRNGSKPSIIDFQSGETAEEPAMMFQDLALGPL